MVKRYLKVLFCLFSFSMLNAQNDEIQPGFLFGTEICLGTGIGNVIINESVLDANYERTVGARLYSGYRFPSNLTFGASVFYDSYSEASFLLFGGDVRYFVSTGELSPYICANGGYGVVLNDDDQEGGFYLYPALGLRLAVNGPYAVIFSLGYKLQYYTETNEFETLVEGNTILSESTDDYRVGFLNASIGLLF